jgi:hypothetical protein
LRKKGWNSQINKEHRQLTALNPGKKNEKPKKKPGCNDDNGDDGTDKRKLVKKSSNNTQSIV